MKEIWAFSEETHKHDISRSSSTIVDFGGSKQIMRKVDISDGTEFARKVVKDKDKLFVEMESQEIWLNVLLRLELKQERSFNSEFEMKVDCSMKGEMFKRVI